ncbi:hypothetical protein RJ639_034353 [Escallonia herrerae]|uniref:Transposase (putative) gypsy type domain-containing protein n=1 Tax=Escallonia herrerae TaxID=1293975 RepID=A0AA88WUA8_9ASTE|nr:hypothetical protein RJ639_034353 [Escallonia herrerae]
MSTEDLLELIREYPLPKGWYASLPGLQERANYGTKFETTIYEDKVKSGHRLPLHPFALRFFKHYHMAPGQLVPNGWRKLFGLIYLVQTSGYKPDATNFMRVFFKICFVKRVVNYPGWFLVSVFLSMSIFVLTLFFVTKMASGSGKSPQGGFFGILQKAKGKRKEKQSSVELSSAPKKTRVTPPNHSSLIVERVLIDKDPIFCPDGLSRVMTSGCQTVRYQSSILFTEFFLGTRSLLFQFLFQMYAYGSAMLSRFEMARQVAIEEALQKREAIKEAEEATHRAEELSKQEADYLAQIASLEKKLERVKRRWQKRRRRLETKAFTTSLMEWLTKNG